MSDFFDAVYDALGISYVSKLMQEKEPKSEAAELSDTAQKLVTQAVAPVKYQYRPTTFESYIGQDKGKDKIKLTIELIKKGYPKHFLLTGNAGHGKCHAKGTKILMHDGRYKNVEEIVVDDMIMGIDSLPRTVKRVGRGYGAMYEIIPSKGKSFIVNEEHILSLKRTGTDETINISVLEYLKRFKKGKNTRTNFKLYRKAIDFKEQKLPLDPYF